MTMTRLSSYEFVEKIKNSPAWRLTFDIVAGELELTVKDDTDADPETFYGPDPVAMETFAYKWFLKSVDAVTSDAMRRSAENASQAHAAPGEGLEGTP